MYLYFAYGSCMNEKDLSRTVEAKTIGKGVLKNYRLGFTRYSHNRKGGVADIVYSKGDTVEGMLFLVPDYKGLDAREGHPFVYRRRTIRVYVPALKREVFAFTYEIVKKSLVDIAPSDYYASLILEGAKQLSPEYQENIKKQIELLQSHNKYKQKNQQKVRYKMPSRSQQLAFDFEMYLEERLAYTDS